MTRDKILKQYDVNEHGIITSPGKFEGEMLYMPHFYDLYMNGMYNSNDDGSFSIPIEKREKEMFPEIGKRKRVINFDIDENGFVWESR
jgi:hypothetical protein